MDGRAGSRFGRAVVLGAASVVLLSTVLLAGCAAESGGDSAADGARSPTPTATAPAPAATGSGSVEPLDDGEYRAAVYVPGGLSPSDELAAGTLVDLGDGCLGLESDDGRRSLAAFPVGTTLSGGVVSLVGMDAFSLGQPLRYGGTAGALDEPRASLAVPEGCRDDATEVWYFVVPKSAGAGAAAPTDHEQPDVPDRAGLGWNP